MAVTETLTIGAHSQLLKLKRGMSQAAVEFYIVVFIFCTLVRLVRCGSCPLDEVQKQVDKEACGSYKDGNDATSQQSRVSKIGLDNGSRHPRTLFVGDNVCGSSDSLCFSSTLHEFLSGARGSKRGGVDVNKSGYEQSAREDSNSSWLSNRKVKCSLDIKEVTHVKSASNVDNTDKRDTSFSSQNFEAIKSQTSNGLFPCVEISPPYVDWGQRFLYLPSLSSLTVKNACNDSEIIVHAPFSTNTQFHPCNSSEISLGPGEVASLCFVFLPTLLGFSSAHLILQTSLGGFLIQAKGYAIESPYKILPFTGFNISSNGWWRKHLSLFNSFNESIRLEEVTASISIYMENASLSVEAICREKESRDDLQDYHAPKLLDVRGGRVGSSKLAITPLNWVIGPQRTESVMEMGILPELGGKVSGIVYMQFSRPLRDEKDILMVPLEAEIDRIASSKNIGSMISASVESIGPCNINETVVVSVSVRNRASDLLKIIEIRETVESRKLFQIKYSKGLLLFPGTDTSVAVVSYRSMNTGFDVSLERPETNMSCRLQILTNASGSPQIEVTCGEIIRSCYASRDESFTGHSHQADTASNSNTGTGPLRSSKEIPVLHKAMEKENVNLLQNWRGQATNIELSVLDDNEIFFPVVPVGRQYSKSITVKNPSQQPVIMQLILNSEEVQNRKTPGDYSDPPSFRSFVHDDSTTPTSHGFSIGENGLTEAFVHPYSTALLGPILFHPSNRCEWKSSVLIRSNLSGIEWLSLRGFGGSISLVLLEGSALVHRIEFQVNTPFPSCLSLPPHMIDDVEDAISSCSKPLSKTFFAVNTGDLPIDVKRIDVSGSECGLDGFIVRNCKSFSLNPGESTELEISYQTDFSVPMIERDLELTLAAGILVVPMKASMPVYMLSICRKTMFLARVKKFCVAILVAAILMLVFLYFLLPQIMVSGSLYYLVKSKHTKEPLNPMNGNLEVLPTISSLLSSLRKDRVLMAESVRYPEGQSKASNDHSAEHTKSFKVSQTESINHSTSLSLKPVKVEYTDKLEPERSTDLTIRTGKDKRRRRRRRKGGCGGLTGLVEVSSSQSGNSTPTSPLSPLVTSTPQTTYPPSPDKKRPTAPEPNANAPVVSVRESGEKIHHFDPKKTASKPMLLPSASFPVTGRSGLRTLHDRAPGSQLGNQKTVKLEKGEMRVEDRFAYDIWGNHFSALHLMSRPSDLSAVSLSSGEGESESFFLRGPQTLVKNSRLRSVSSFHDAG